MFRLLKNLLADHYLVLIVFSFSWLPIYYGFRGLDLLARKLLINFPIYCYIWYGRRILGLPAWRAKVLSCKEPVADTEVLAVKISELYNSVDRKVTHLRKGQPWTIRVLREEGIEEELKAGVKDHWAILESDHALCRAISNDEQTSTSGILSFLGNTRNDTREIRNLIFRTLKLGSRNARTLALFHCKGVIEDAAQFNQLEALVSEWTEHERLEAQPTTENIRKVLGYLPPVPTHIESAFEDKK